MKNLIFVKIILVWFLFCSNAFAVEVLVWGPNKYSIATEPHINYNETITATTGTARLVVKNGIKVNGNVYHSLNDAAVLLNGQQIFGPENFNKNTHILEVQINLAETNELLVGLQGATNDFLTVEIVKDVELPPDPGDAGKETLLGIDSDNDGVRDDIQRYIYFTYPNEEKVRLALFQIARAYQELLPSSSVPDLAHEKFKKMDCSVACLFYIKGGVLKASGIYSAIHAEILNTKERMNASFEFTNSLAGKTTRGIPLRERKNCCFFDLDEETGGQ